MDLPREAAEEEGKLRLVCSHGGRILLPLPDDPRRRRLRYVGGDTHVISLSRRSSLGDLRLKLLRLLSPQCPFFLKYHLPSEGALRPLSSDADLHDLLLEHDRLPGSSRVRVFLFPVDPFSVDSLLGLEEVEELPDSPAVDTTASSPFGSAGSALSLASLPPILMDFLPSSTPAADAAPVASPTDVLVSGGRVFSSDDEGSENGLVGKPPPPPESSLERSFFCNHTDPNVGFESEGDGVTHDSTADKLQNQILELTEQFLLQQQQQQQQNVHQDPYMVQQQAGTQLMPLQSLYTMCNQIDSQPIAVQNRPFVSQMPLLFIPVQLNGAYSIPIQQPNPVYIGGNAAPPSDGFSEFATPTSISQTTVQSVMPPIPQFIHRPDRKNRQCVMGHNPMDQLQNTAVSGYPYEFTNGVHTQQMHHTQSAPTLLPQYLGYGLGHAHNSL